MLLTLVSSTWKANDTAAGWVVLAHVVRRDVPGEGLYAAFSYMTENFIRCVQNEIGKVVAEPH